MGFNAGPILKFDIPYKDIYRQSCMDVIFNKLGNSSAQIRIMMVLLFNKKNTLITEQWMLDRTGLSSPSYVRSRQALVEQGWLDFDPGKTITVNLQFILSHFKDTSPTLCVPGRSFGENRIATLLSLSNIPYTIEQTFDTCVFEDTGAYARFDFYVNNEYIIEFDGEQHSKNVEIFNGEKGFNKTKEHDLFKNKWCMINNIPLIRIPNSRLKNVTIEDLLIDTSDYRIC